MTCDANVGTCKSRNLQPLLTTVSVSYGYFASTLTQNDNSAMRSMLLVLPSLGPDNYYNTYTYLLHKRYILKCNIPI